MLCFVVTGTHFLASLATTLVFTNYGNIILNHYPPMLRAHTHTPRYWTRNLWWITHASVQNGIDIVCVCVCKAQIADRASLRCRRTARAAPHSLKVDGKLTVRVWCLNPTVQAADGRTEKSKSHNTHKRARTCAYIHTHEPTAKTATGRIYVCAHKDSRWGMNYRVYRPQVFDMLYRSMEISS